MQKKFYKDLYNLEDKHWWHRSKRLVVSKLIKQFKLGDGKKIKILDVGCGTGKNLEEMGRFGTAYGVDISEEAIKFCKKRGLKNAVVGSSYKTTFKKSSFDLATLLDVLEHTDDDKTLTEINRILRPNAYLIITVPAFQFLWSRWDDVLDHKRRYTKKNLSRVLKRNGFLPVRISYMYSFLILPALLIRLIKSSRYKKDYPSDFHLSNHFLNSLMLGLCKIEYFLSSIINLPFGTSLVCISRKKSK